MGGIWSAGPRGAIAMGSVLLMQNKREDGCVGVFCLCFAALIAGVNGHRTIITVVHSTSASGLSGGWPVPQRYCQLYITHTSLAQVSFFNYQYSRIK